MSVSVATLTPNVDLNAIVSGGDQFMARLKALQDAKAEHDESLKNLRLGHDVVRAMQDVQAREQMAIDAISSAKAEAEKIIAEAKADAEDTIAKAKADATQLIAEGVAEAKKLSADVDAAHAELGKWSDNVKRDVLQMQGVREASARMQEAFASLHDKIVSLTTEY
jgi:regulator of protease activity HflC (stomatin/prohibitin superfamily)